MPEVARLELTVPPQLEEMGVAALERRLASEIRRTEETTRSRTGRPRSFDLYFDGEPVAWNVKTGGLSADRYAVGFSGQTDAVGNEYSRTVESLKIYRERVRQKTTSERR